MYFPKDADSVPPPSNHPGSTGAGPRHLKMVEMINFMLYGFFKKFIYLVVTACRIFSSESAVRIRWPKYWSFAGVQPRWIQGDLKVGTESASWKKLI